jgi:hypothetical protein
MGEVSEPAALDDLISQLAALKSSSTKLRIDSLRKLQNEIEHPSMIEPRSLIMP